MRKYVYAALILLVVFWAWCVLSRRQLTRDWVIASAWQCRKTVISLLADWEASTTRESKEAFYAALEDLTSARDTQAVEPRAYEINTRDYTVFVETDASTGTWAAAFLPLREGKYLHPRWKRVLFVDWDSRSYFAYFLSDEGQVYQRGGRIVRETAAAEALGNIRNEIAAHEWNRWGDD